MSSRINVLELFAGRGPVSKMASSYGLSGATPIDYNTGHDLRLADHRRRCVSMIIGHLRPLRLLLSIHCTPWLIMQENMSYAIRMDELHQRRSVERPIIQDAMRWCHQQHEHGHYYLIENPEMSEPSVVNHFRTPTS